MEEVPERWWIVVESDVLPKYYYESGTDSEGNPTTATFVKEKDTELTWTASWTVKGEDGSVTDENSNVAVDRYLSGVWYLLFGCEICPGTAESGCTHGTGDVPEGSLHFIDGLDKTDMPILDIASVVTDASTTIKTLPLWMLWLHEFIDENPYAQITGGFDPDGDEGAQTKVTNLNELSINGAIGFVKYLLTR